MVPAVVLSKINQDPQGAIAAQYYKSMAVYELALTVILISSCTFFFLALGFMREMLTVVLGLTWERGFGFVFIIGLAFFPLVSFSTVRSVISVDSATIYKLGGLWGSVLIPYVLTLACLVLSVGNLLAPAFSHRTEEYALAMRRTKSSK